jgi:hypothetical protein
MSSLRPWLVAAALAGCGGSSTKPSDATLVITCRDRDAQLFVDDGYAGLAAESAIRPLPLGAGFHRVEVRAPGRFTAFRGVRLARGDRRTLDVTLRPELDGGDAPAVGSAAR